MRRWLLALAGCCSAVSWQGVAGAQEVAPTRPDYQLEVGPTVTLVSRRSSEPSSSITVSSAFAPGLHFRVALLPWLRVSGRYSRALHDVKLAPGALGTSAVSPSGGASVVEVDPLHVTSIDGRVHPTYSPVPRLHLMASVGLGWSSALLPRVRENPPSGPSQRLRTGSFIDVPLGLGVVVDVVPRWVTISYEATYAPTLKTSGDLYTSEGWVKGDGQLGEAGAFTRFGASFGHAVALSLSL